MTSISKFASLKPWTGFDKNFGAVIILLNQLRQLTKKVINKRIDINRKEPHKILPHDISS